MHETDIILAVDLDGTLIKTDILHETFWSAFSKNWKTTYKVIPALFKGKANLKNYLNNFSEINIRTLPFNKSVIEYVKKFKERGGRTALVTASNINIAKNIADHLGIFDEVYGSSSTSNLSGRKKLELLTSKYGKKKFSYMGNSSVDLIIWKYAFKAISVNASSVLKKACNSINPNTEHLRINSSYNSIEIYIKALRVHQWLKNFLVFLPMFASHKITVPYFLESLIAFISFSLISSSVYVLNDLLDLNADRAHPRKKERPFASGSIPISYCIIIIPFCFLLGIATTFFINKSFLIIILIYYILTAAYSLFLKRKVIIDIFTLASLYTTRIIAGGAATQIEISFWLLGFSIFIFLSLAAVKRQAELVDLGKRGILKSIGRGYCVNDLKKINFIAILSGFISVLIIGMYTRSTEVLLLYPNPYILWGVCCILSYWLIKMIIVSYRGEMDDDPIVFAVNDRMSQILFIAIVSLILLSATSFKLIKDLIF